MKKLTFILAIIAAATLYSCADETKEVIKEVKVSNLPDSLQIIVNDANLLKKYNAIIDSIKGGYYGSVPDFFIVSYGTNRNSNSSLIRSESYKGNQLSFQFFKSEKRYSFITKKVKDLSPGNEYITPAMQTTGITFNPYFYTGQFVYQVVQTY